MPTNIIVIIDRLANKRLPRINITNNPAHRAEAYVQALLCRCLDLSSGAILSFDNNYLIAAASAAKSLCETVAIAVWFEKELSDAIKSADEKASQKLCIKYTLAHGPKNEPFRKIAIANMGSSNKDSKAAQAMNAITIIGECAKIGHEEIQELYNGLCEHDHPNALGTFLYFTHVDPSQKDTILIHPSEKTMNEVSNWIGGSLKLLLTFEKTFENLNTKILPELRELLSKE